MSSSLAGDNGWPVSLGCALRDGGARFSVFSRHATRMHLALFDEPRDARPAREIALDPATHRLGDIWSVRVDGVRPGQLYAWRAEGPYDPGKGLYLDPDLLLLDPYARALTDGSAWTDPDSLPGMLPPGHLLAAERDRQWSSLPKAVVVHSEFDWEGDRPLRRSLAESVIYELHVRGFTAHPDAGVDHPGTYLGLVEKIPYLQQLGVTAVELLPVQEFDQRENPRLHPVTGERLVNFWGYSPLAFFAPEERYSHLGSCGGQVDAFKAMVKALHSAGIEVILDVVFNHTAEGDERGPTVSMRGLDNRIYYMLTDGGARYRNLTGCGNTVNCNHPVVRTLIRDCLRYWVAEMHVDGFRFDLASVLGRDTDGRLLENPPLIEMITEDPVLRGTKLIAEAWDAAGAYQVGSFPGLAWSEWNGRYRDDVRRFWRGDPGMLGAFATRLAGSADLYRGPGRLPHHSINFVTAHDGFTLADLVSYARRHNALNGEDGADGNPDEHSANHGHEGPTDDPHVRALRDRQVRNMLATLLLSRGVPMLLAGDELGRTQGGNNNAYCHDDPTSWVDWNGEREHGDLLRFVGVLLSLRRRTPTLTRDAFYEGGLPEEEQPDIRWFGPDGGEPAWHDPSAHALGCVLAEPEGGVLVLLFNADADERGFNPPQAVAGWTWQRIVDTAATPPRDVLREGERAAGPAPWIVAASALVVLRGRR